MGETGYFRITNDACRPQLTDQQLAASVRAAMEALSKAVARARNAGLTVNFSVIPDILPMERVPAKPWTFDLEGISRTTTTVKTVTVPHTETVHL